MVSGGFVVSSGRVVGPSLLGENLLGGFLRERRGAGVSGGGQFGLSPRKCQTAQRYLKVIDIDAGVYYSIQIVSVLLHSQDIPQVQRAQTHHGRVPPSHA